MMNIQSPPVLLIIFNRPLHTKKTLEAIRLARPSRLYVVADGPRANIDEDVLLCEEARQVVESGVNWPCKVIRLYRDDNYSIGKGVSEAITWFFEHESEGIILEDDCVPHPLFFRFCEELLDYYRDDRRVMCITGDNFQTTMERYSWSYYFSKYNHCWGWASWRRAWDLFDYDLKLLPDFLEARTLDSISSTPGFSDYWRTIFQACHLGEIDSWAYRWTFSCWVNNGLTCTPKCNLVSNIGFGKESTHTLDENCVLANIPVNSLDFPLKHPPAIWMDNRFDMNVDRINFGIVSPYRKKINALVRRFRRIRNGWRK